jgi:hypothetical protein
LAGENEGVKLSAAPMEDELQLALPPGTHWFAPRCCVVVGGESREVVVGGMLVATVGPKDVGLRNLLLVGLAQEQQVHLGALSRAFGLSSEAVRQLRRLYEAEGVEALLGRRRGGRVSTRRTAVEARARRLFEAGHTVDAVHAAVKGKVSRATVARIRQEWAQQREAPATPEEVEDSPEAGDDAVQLPLVVAEQVVAEQVVAEQAVVPAAESAPEGERLGTRAPESAALVQHAGTWLLIATVHALGLHKQALALAGKRVAPAMVRLALDAVVAALALGEGCVEGVRRLATSSAAALLLAARAPSPTWTRRVLGRLAEGGGGAALHLGMGRVYVEAARQDAQAEGPVFYVDNHMRPYTGKYTLRKGWRMQDKRVRPGASDYYVHDEDGRPVGRLTAPHHGSLTAFLGPLCATLRLALPKERVLIAFDRAGAFPEAMAALRDADFEFVTYERRPYALLAASAFTEEVLLGGEVLRWCEVRQRNLGKGRGRVRRVCVLTEDGRQVNLLAHSTRPAVRLIEVMRGRWAQENGFKHGGERWGLNQLDGRSTQPYAPDTVVPNPARRRLEAALRIWRVREGDARRQLARLEAGDTRPKRLEDDLAQALAAQRRLEALRPSTPTRAPLAQTELAGKLVHHEVEYKLLVDTVRIACANAESQLAAGLAPLLPRAAEAKKTLATLFTAPGRVHVNDNSLTVTLRPAGTKRELEALAVFLADVSQGGLSLPGDGRARRLRFRIHQVS